MSAAARPSLVVRAAVHAVIYAAALAMFVPVAWMITSSLKTQPEALSATPTFLPTGPPGRWQWSNYAEAWEIAELGRFYGNSLLVAIVVTVLSVAHNAIAGFAFAKLRFRARRTTFGLMMATMLLPFQVYFIFLYVLCGWLGYVDQLQALIVPFLASAFGVFYMRQSILTVPDSLLEAARIDGMSDFAVFWHIVVPLVRPGLGALAIFTFMASWNNFFWPLIVIDSTDKFTLPLAVNRLTTDYFTPSPPVRMAAATILILPTVIVYLIFERAFIKGMTLTGVKG
jgi:ABC-type glycerol-3-phosphate transport system permease component